MRNEAFPLRRVLLVLFVFAQIVCGTDSWAQGPVVKQLLIYYYGTNPSTLTGKIRTVSYPGPPNFDSIKAGDRSEYVYIFFLDDPISVMPKPGTKEDFEEPTKNIKKLHLVVYSERRTKVLENRPVKVTGTFFSAHTGHHRTDVLMEVEKIEAIK